MSDQTERLRALLDERGVEWDYGITGPTTTRFRVNGVNGVDLTFTPMRDGLLCSTILTPEQVIAATLGISDTEDASTDTDGHDLGHVRDVSATLGSCNCSNSKRTEACRLDDFADVPFSVDYEIEGYDMGSSRDYATLAECNSCGAYVIVPPSYHHVLTCDGDEVYQPYRFCPNCGRRIEVDDG